MVAVVGLGICATILLAGAVSLAEPVLAPVAFALLVVALAWPVQRGAAGAGADDPGAARDGLVTLVVLVVLALAAGWGFGRVARWVIANAGQLQVLYAQQAGMAGGAGYRRGGGWLASSTAAGWCGSPRRCSGSCRASSASSA